MNSQQALKELVQSVQREQDELTLQKNYLSEAERILTSETLAGSFQALLNCMNDYPSYLFKREKEFIFFFTRLNDILGVKSADVTNFADPNIFIMMEKAEFKMYFYYTVKGVCEITFDYQGIDMGIKIECDVLQKELRIQTRDLLHLNASGVAKSVIVHYLANMMEEFRSIDFKVETEKETNVDPFLQYTVFEFEKLPKMEDRDFDRLFISMDGKGDMRYTDDHTGVILVLDDDNTVYIRNRKADVTSRVRMENSKEKIYLFDLIAENPFLEQLFEGETQITTDKDKKKKKK